MTITCPKCGFTRDAEQSQLPARAVVVTCPRCQEKFPLKREEPVTSPAAPAAGEPAHPEEESPRPKVSCPVCGQQQAAAERCARCGAAFVAMAAALPVPFAGFWIRAVASTLDMLAVGLLESVLGSLLVRIGGIEPALTSPEGRALGMVVAAFGMVLGYAYRVFFIGHCGQTPGKMAVRIKVVRTDGTELDYTRALLREVVGKFLSKIILGIGYLMVAFDARKQGLHDKIADTYVIRL